MKGTLINKRNYALDTVIYDSNNIIIPPKAKISFDDMSKLKGYKLTDVIIFEEKEVKKKKSKKTEEVK